MGSCTGACVSIELFWASFTIPEKARQDYGFDFKRTFIIIRCYSRGCLLLASLCEFHKRYWLRSTPFKKIFTVPCPLGLQLELLPHVLLANDSFNTQNPSDIDVI